MKTFYDTQEEISEGDRYFSIHNEVLPVAKKEDKHFAQIVMSSFDDQSEEEDSEKFQHLENAIRHCFEQFNYTGVTYVDYRMDKIIFLSTT